MNFVLVFSSVMKSNALTKQHDSLRRGRSSTQHGYPVYISRDAHAMLDEIKRAQGHTKVWQLETAVREFYERRMPKAAESAAPGSPPPAPVRK